MRPFCSYSVTKKNQEENGEKLIEKGEIPIGEKKSRLSRQRLSRTFNRGETVDS